MVAAGIRDLKRGVFLLLPIFAFVLFTLSAINSQFFHLPKQIQRGLAFFPGQWDSDMANDAAASNDFRRRIWTLWANEYFPVQPWLGRGFGFRSEWSQRSIYTYRGATDYPQMVETGNLHNGFLAALDTFGIVGTLFFIAWNVRLLIQTFRVKLRRNDPGGIALRFLALYLAVLIISYWVGSSSVGSFLPLEFALAGVFLRLQSSVNPEAGREKRAVSPSPVLREAPVSA
jgi:O-antigen ligase